MVKVPDVSAPNTNCNMKNSMLKPKKNFTGSEYQKQKTFLKRYWIK